MNPASVSAAAGAVRRSLAPLPTGVFAGFVVAIAAVLVTTYLAYASLTDRTATAERTTEAYEVLGRMQNVLALVTDAETAERGFLITGNETYLEPYNAARAAVSRQIAELQKLLEGHPDQQRRLDALAQAVQQKMEDIDRIIALHRAGNIRAAVERRHRARSRRHGPHPRLVAEMEREGGLDLAARHASGRRRHAARSSSPSAARLLLLVLIGFAAWAARRATTASASDRSGCAPARARCPSACRATSAWRRWAKGARVPGRLPRRARSARSTSRRTRSSLRRVAAHAPCVVRPARDLVAGRATACSARSRRTAAPCTCATCRPATSSVSSTPGPRRRAASC